MQRSSAVNLRSVSKPVDESDSFDSEVDSNNENDLMTASNRTKSQEFAVEICALISEYKIPFQVNDYPFMETAVSEFEYNLEEFNSQITPSQHPRIEPIECVIVNVAHNEQFPKPTSSFSATLPSVFSWFNSNSFLSSEYPSMINGFYKKGYGSIRNKIRFVASMAPTYDKLSNLAAIRSEVATGRVLFHYVGFGFPEILPDSIWCSDRRSTDFIPYPISQLFEKLVTPLWFVFDCSNAGCVIPTLEEATTKLQKKDLDTNNWENWICICATSAGESLPDDPYLPKDFLTSCILTPVKMAVVCHLLLHYRSSVLKSDYPSEIPCQHLFTENTEEYNALSTVLTALTDAIAADSLSHDQYHQFFRCDRSSAVIFRNFLLAQYLLRPYRAHPVARPSLPDLSMHSLWHHWSVTLDTAICSKPIPKPMFATNLFSSAYTSFKMLIENKKYNQVKPYHIILLFHMLLLGKDNDSPIYILAEYAASPESSPQMLSSSAVFFPLFQRMIATEPQHPVFHSLCFLILALLHHKPEFMYEIRKELDVTKFPYYLFDKSIFSSTKVLIAAILANLAVSCEQFQHICSKVDFLSQIRIELQKSSPLYAVWLLLIIRRSFHLYSPDPAVYVSNGLHAQCCMHLFSKIPPVRAAAVSALAAFIRPFECNINGQLLYLTLPVMYDASYLVRFHFVLLLKKFVTSFESYSQSVVINEEQKFPHTSFSSMISSFFGSQAGISMFSNADENIFSYVDSKIHSSNFLSHAYALSMALLNYYINDPHPSVSSIANRVIKYITHSRNSYDQSKIITEEFIPSSPFIRSENFFGDIISYSGEDEEFEEENFSFQSIDQNESLHAISLHNIISRREWVPIDSFIDPGSKCEQKALPPPPLDFLYRGFQVALLSRLPITTDPINYVSFHHDSLGLAVATDSEVFFIDVNQKIRSIEVNKGNICDLLVVDWDNTPFILLSTDDGCIHVWNPAEVFLRISFCADPSMYQTDNAEKKLFIVAGASTSDVFSASSITSVVCRWNLKTERLIGEWEIGNQSPITSLSIHPKNSDVVIVGSQNGVIKEINFEKSSTCISTNIISPQPKISVSKISTWLAKEGEQFFALVKEKSIVKWDSSWFSKQVIEQKNIKDFSVSRMCQLIVIVNNSAPVAIDFSGKEHIIFKDISQCRVCATHPQLPVFCFGTQSGEVFMYQLRD